jgi:hypothetical protein
MTKKHQFTSLLEVLVHIRLSYDLNMISARDEGICGFLISLNVGNQLSGANEMLFQESLQEQWVRWPMFSGNPTFPVPGPTGECAMDIYMNSPDVWSGAYGQLRLEMLDWLIKELVWNPRANRRNE